MITSFLLSILNGFLNMLLQVLPAGALPDSIASSFSSVWGYVNAFSYVVAVDTLILVVVLVVAFDLILLGWSFVNWIIRKVPGMQ